MKVRLTVIYILFLTILLIPMGQMVTRWAPEPELTGAYQQPEKPVLQAQNWFDGSYQTAFDAYMNDHLGFHNTMVVGRNYLRFALFREVSVPNVLLGKHNYLYEQDYIDAHYGLDFIGEDSVARQVAKIRRLQDALAENGKTLLVVLAPSKADYCPENIPSYQVHPETDQTNYKVFRNLLKEKQVNVVDYNAYFQSQKAVAKYPLYPVCGIHWSEYSMLGVADSLKRHIEQMRGVKLPDIVIYSEKISKEPQGTDYDLGNLLNLPGQLLTSQELCYPQWYWSDYESEYKPEMIVVADSYYWGPYNVGFQQYCFQGKFWYYNSTVFPDSYDKDLKTSELDIKEALDKAEIVVIMSTTPGLKVFSWGFVDRALSEWCDDKK